MGRLAGFRYRDVAKRLRSFGFEFERMGAGSHEIWTHKASGAFTLLSRHPGDFAEGTLRTILRQAGISPDDFLAD